MNDNVNTLQDARRLGLAEPQPTQRDVASRLVGDAKADDHERTASLRSLHSISMAASSSRTGL